jgi:hypothetical protein
MSSTPNPHQYAVEKIFPAERLKEFNTSDLVRSLDPHDFEDLEKEFSIPPVKTSNPKIAQLTTHDLVSIEGLFHDYRSAIVANFHGVEQVPYLRAIAESSSCCCCCTPCCSCCSAATQMEPLGH